MDNDKHENIPVPSKTERESSIQIILDKGLAPTPPAWRNLPFSALVFGIEDCLFLAVLLSLLPLGFVFIPPENLANLLTVLVFLSSPMLYAAAHMLSMWKESLNGTLEWKRTCRISLQTLIALRMLLFGGAALLMCAPVDMLLWHVSGHTVPLCKVIAISFSSLFMYAALSLACRTLRWGPVIPVIVWTLLDITLLCYEPWSGILLHISTTAFFLLTGAGLAYCISQIRLMLDQPNKGGIIYAFR